eukprot:TRINITY_DN23645_c0_g1_i2.p1 TRINITY_DN23645_c0_g1~~TRINITY_DN23645_c0_g1_i2.p1  ORF type:complete len:115 (+),score=30.62 TRINITY_DN23645_c0_g1_i2:43-387(+)
MAEEPKPFLTRAERLVEARQEKLEDLKRDCEAANALGKRELVWGSMVPAVMAGSEEDMDEVLVFFARDLEGAGFSNIEWFKAKAPTAWQQEAIRFGSHVQLRAHWPDELFADPF